MDAMAARDQSDKGSRHITSSLSKKIREVKQNASEVKEAAQEFATAGVGRRRWGAASRLLDALFAGEAARMLARLLICLYYVNLAYADIEMWQHLRTPEAQARMKRWQDDAPASHLPFPYLSVCGLMPVALLAASGLGPSWLFCGLLLCYTVCNDAWMTWGHLKNLLLHKGRPSELLMKQLALIGSAALMLAHSIRDAPRLRSVTAGLLQAADAPRVQPGRGRSSVLLLGRLMVGVMLLVAGYMQALRIKARMASAAAAAAAGAAPQPVLHHYGMPDGHDSSLQLVECLLAIPLALGLYTAGVSRLLCLVLLAEAATQWGWWGAGWPSWHYRQHVRDHFFTNAAVAGGLLLMQSFGAGLFTVDSLLAKQD
ncbi:hypothetical protein OEZ86_000525 [Tetradesmus obliquus]|nr:hypothetical protein OEZ86_000525 [Tetradesmus obliquus]